MHHATEPGLGADDSDDALGNSVRQWTRGKGRSRSPGDDATVTCVSTTVHRMIPSVLGIIVHSTECTVHDETERAQAGTDAGTDKERSGSWQDGSEASCNRLLCDAAVCR